MEIEWGTEIAVDGKRPEWLRDGERVWGKSSSGIGWYDFVWIADRYNWNCISHIRLPASHPAYIAIAKGFIPWGGGDEAPGDADLSEPVLFANGKVSTGSAASYSWRKVKSSYDIIGYRRKPEAISPQPIGSSTVTELSIKVDTTELKAAIAATASYTVTRDGLTITGPDLAHILRSIREDGE